MRKRLVTLGMAGLMTAMSVVPAFAADPLTAVGGQLTEGQKYTNGEAYKQFKGLNDDQDSIEDVDYWQDETYGGEGGKEFGVAGSKSTEVGVQQAMSYTVTIPSFISLAGENTGNKDDNKAAFYVAVTGDIAGSSEITVKPNLASAIAKAPENEKANYSDFGSTVDTTTTGTFPLQEDGKMKRDLVATIELKDIDWTMTTDGTQLDDTRVDEAQKLGIAMSKVDGYDATKFSAMGDVVGAHAGIISVDKLSAGTFRNTINFDVAYTNTDVKTETPEVTP